MFNLSYTLPEDSSDPVVCTVNASWSFWTIINVISYFLVRWQRTLCKQGKIKHSKINVTSNLICKIIVVVDCEQSLFCCQIQLEGMQKQVGAIDEQWSHKLWAVGGALAACRSWLHHTPFVHHVCLFHVHSSQILQLKGIIVNLTHKHRAQTCIKHQINANFFLELLKSLPLATNVSLQSSACFTFFSACIPREELG